MKGLDSMLVPRGAVRRNEYVRVAGKLSYCEAGRRIFER